MLICFVRVCDAYFGLSYSSHCHVRLCRNCLFRALGDQLDGHSKHHLKHRQDVVDYMVQHRDDFEPFVEDDVPFQRHGLCSSLNFSWKLHAPIIADMYT